MSKNDNHHWPLKQQPETRIVRSDDFICCELDG